MSCACPVPREKPHDAGNCRSCGKVIEDRWVSNDRNFAEFFGRLRALPGVDRAFVDQCRSRELAGRDIFGHAFLGRQNADEGSEEAADLALYCYLGLLRARRERRHEQIELALEAAQHAAKAHATLLRLRAAGG